MNTKTNAIAVPPKRRSRRFAGRLSSNRQSFERRMCRVREASCLSCRKIETALKEQREFDLTAQ
ncbi:MAG TPA: hypothetical protein VF089_19615, partial [Candidatus Binatia bacterium]